MISFDEALTAVLEHARSLEVTEVPLDRALGNVLAEPIVAPFDLPLFDNSAVDGFGVRVADVGGASAESPVRLPLDRTIRAGDDASMYRLPLGCAVKILTGAMVPSGVEAVVMREHAREEGGEVRIRQTGASALQVVIERSVHAGENIRRKGEEFRAGAELLVGGTRITPPVVGLLATVGQGQVRVHRQPRVTIVVTGDELVELGQSLKLGQIYESNARALAAILADMHIHDVQRLHLADDKEAIRRGLAEALANADVLITVGGVSVGDYDYVKEALAELGVRHVYWRVNMKPGQPNYFGVKEGGSGSRTLVFGLPGNPVSAQISFHQLVRPALLKMMGMEKVERQLIFATLAEGFTRRPGRREFIRGRAESNDGQLAVRALPGQGSHMQGGLALANCIIDVPAEQERLATGEQVLIEWLTWRH